MYDVLCVVHGVRCTVCLVVYRVVLGSVYHCACRMMSRTVCVVSCLVKCVVGGVRIQASGTVTRYRLKRVMEWGKYVEITAHFECIQ